jgi:hypothetical protein
MTARRKPGRPRLAPQVTKIDFVLPVPLRRKIDAVAKARQMKRGAAVRHLIERGLGR